MSIKVENLTHIYSINSPFQRVAINNISFNIEDGEFIGIIGHTGSGKSTLIQHLNGLIKPNDGKIFIDGQDINGEKCNLKQIRSKVGLVFQYPEYQLFEETVYEDIAFGPKNLNLSEEEIKGRVLEAIHFVGLEENLLTKSPFELSGGQKRRVAIAGVLAMNPSILVLDEPTAGLDPASRNDLLNRLKVLHKTKRTTIILVSHSMEEIATTVEKVMVMAKGEVVFFDTVQEIFKKNIELKTIGLDVPQICDVISYVQSKGYNIENNIYDVEKVSEVIYNIIKGAKMLKDITLGQYFPIDSLIHKLDPRIKIFSVILIIISVFMCKNPITFLFIISFNLLTIFLSKIKLTIVLKTLKPVAFLILFTAIINIFLTDGDNYIFQWRFLKITTEGLYSALTMALRIMLLVSFTSLLTFTTSPIRLTDGIESILKPFSKIGLPSHELAMMMTIALRFIPTLLEETDKIIMAQKSRGADFESGNVFKRAKALIPILVPLFINSFRRADELATAMECRCYRGGENRTKLRELKIKSYDIYTIIFIIVFLPCVMFLGEYLI